MDNKIRNWINDSKLGYFDWNGNNSRQAEVGIIARRC